MKRLHGICLAIFLLPFSVVSVAKPQISKADSSESAPLTLADILKASPTVLPDPTRLLDASVPLGERQKIFNVFEKLADNGNTYSQYVVGSLYRIGRQLPASPVQSDVNKASLYLSNAATHGRILAMAKMAEMKLREGDYLEAMNWAQIFGHYATLLPQADRPSPGYIAELIERIDEKFDRSKLPEVVKNVNIFVVNYDASVKEGVTNYTSGSNADLRQSSPTNQIYTPGTFDPKFANQAPKDSLIYFPSAAS